MNNQKHVREKVIKTFRNNPSWTYKKIAKELRVSRQFVLNVVRKFNKDLTIDRKPGTGKTKKPRNSSKAKKVEKILRADPNVSGREVARCVQCSEHFVCQVKANVGLRTFNVQKVPDRNTKKNNEAKKRAKLIKKFFFQNFECCVMDDESYVFADFS